MFSFLLDSAISACGLNPDKCYGPNHGAPLSMWVVFAEVVVLAGFSLGVAALG